MTLIGLICVVLLVPATVFMATAVRFGGERRDRRLAALRLVGAGIRTTRRIAAGEALFGAVLGLLTGGVLFLLLRRLAGGIQVWNLSAFPADIVPVPAVAALIVVAVPALAVAVTLVALRGVTVEPLGVVRGTGPRRRRLWWRLLLPAVGLAVLIRTRTAADVARLPGDDVVDTDPYPIAAGAALLLVGLTALLPWLVDASVARLPGGGPVSWQLAVRRLQLDGGGAAARAVSGITVAVAGTGILATPAAVDARLLAGGRTRAMLRMADRSPAAEERVRDAAARVDLSLRVSSAQVVERDKAFHSARTALLAAGTVTMAVVALSLLVAQIEQLRERARLLSILAAFGTRRSTLVRSVLWQTAVPVVIGTALATAGGPWASSC
ncbi:FtsX-like permease family protein [Streptomyces sp. NPDC096310]|uniref:FtsX-like permease family protein n=1 Tax=Streptomyces sp. NPDC096310 TaxID=3366082 RepID=UPI00381E1644